MSILDQLLSRPAESIHHNWEMLNKMEQLDEILELSHSKPVVVFKHSVRCGISAMVKYQLENNWGFSEEELKLYFLDIFQNRNISNEIRDRFGVVHQSPQIILFHKGEVVYHTSHHMISVDAIRNNLPSKQA